MCQMSTVSVFEAGEICGIRTIGMRRKGTVWWKEVEITALKGRVTAQKLMIHCMGI